MELSDSLHIRFGKDMASAQTQAADLTESGMFPATDTTTDMSSEDKSVALATHMLFYLYAMSFY